MARLDIPYEILESYAKLQGSFSVLETLFLPVDVHEPMRWIKVWCDEWEDLGDPNSGAIRYLKRRESERRVLRNAMDEASRVLTSKAGTCVGNPITASR